jgi:TonB family protein
MKRTLAMLMLAGSLASPTAAQDNPLNTARELYASARYDEALLVLNGLRPGPGGGDLKSIEQYRSLCLLALGRGAEAEAAIAAVVSADPMYLPSEAEASPRVRTAFSEVRQRQLPEIARARYAAAKATFDRKHYPQAEQQFRELLRIIDDPDMGGRLSDLRLLVAGFLDLSAAAAAPPPEPVNEPRPAAPATPPPPSKPAFDPDHIFTASDPNVIAPVAMKQEVPRVPSTIATQTRDRGILELVIDQQGRVTSIDVKVRMHPMFDSQLIQAAKDWRYKPATLDGKAVRYRKLVQINITK